MRRLVVMRHAKAEPYADTDFDRDLTERGRADASEAGRHLAATGLVPDVAVVSAALRTRRTWDLVREAAGAGSAEERVRRSLYAASPAAVLEELRSVRPAAGTCLYVGHNPTAEYLASTLDDGTAEAGALQGLLEGFVTSALAVFDVEVPWAELDEGAARLTGFHVGRG